MLTADQVWGAAVAAHRINNGYFKYPVINHETGAVEKQANKIMLKDWMSARAENPTTDADIIEGREVRRHFNGYLLLQISGKANDFQVTALKIAQKEQFNPTKDSYDLSVVSCLPWVMFKDHQNRELMNQIRNSEQLTGNEGQAVRGRIRVVRTRFSVQVGKFNITAKLDDNSFVDFWFSQDLAVDSEHEIKGKIKDVRGNNTTRLNYVKILVDKAGV